MNALGVAVAGRVLRAENPDERLTARAGVHHPQIGDERNKTAGGAFLTCRTDGSGIGHFDGGDPQGAAGLRIGQRGRRRRMANEPRPARGRGMEKHAAEGGCRIQLRHRECRRLYHGPEFAVRGIAVGGFAMFRGGGGRGH